MDLTQRQTDRYQPYSKKDRDKSANDPLTEAVRVAALRAKKIATRQMSVDEDDSEHDTASMASSASSKVRPTSHKTGVSPLNRRRSLRLQHKYGDSSMEIASSLSALARQSTTRELRQNLAITSLASQQTVEMKSPPVKLQRMQTSQKWTSWRAKRVPAEQDSALKVAMARTDTIAPPPSLARQPTRSLPSRQASHRKQTLSPIPEVKFD